MAQNIDWQAVNLQNTSINPSQGLAVASNAAKNITDAVAAEEEAQSLARYRQANMMMANRKQNYDEGAEGRAIATEQRGLAMKIAEEKRLLEQSGQQGLLAAQVANDAGWSRADSFFNNPDNVAAMQADPRYQELTNPAPNTGVGMLNPEGLKAQGDAQLKEYNQAFRESNKRLLSDPTAYHQTVLTKLLESGKFSAVEAERVAKEKTTQLFPTLDSTIAGKLLQDYSKGDGSNGSVGSSKSGSNRLLSGVPGAMDTKELVDDFNERHGITNRAPVDVMGIRPFDLETYAPKGWLQRDTTKFDTNKVVSKLSEGADGVQPYYAVKLLDSVVNADGQLPFRVEDLKGDVLAAWKVKAQNFQAAQERTQQARAGGKDSALFSFNQGITDHNNAILHRLNPDQSSREARMQAYFSGLPKAAGNSPQLDNSTYIDVDGTASPVATATPQRPQAAPVAVSTPARANTIMPAEDGGMALNKGILSGQAFNTQRQKDGATWGKASNKEITESNTSLKKVRLFAADDTNKLPSLEDLENAYNYPGLSVAERKAIKDIAKKRSISLGE